MQCFTLLYTPKRELVQLKHKFPFFDDKGTRGTFPADNETRRVPTSIHYSLMIELLSFR